MHPGLLCSAFSNRERPQQITWKQIWMLKIGKYPLNRELWQFWESGIKEWRRLPAVTRGQTAGVINTYMCVSMGLEEVSGKPWPLKKDGPRFPPNSSQCCFYTPLWAGWRQKTDQRGDWCFDRSAHTHLCPSLKWWKKPKESQFVASVWWSCISQRNGLCWTYPSRWIIWLITMDIIHKVGILHLF